MDKQIININFFPLQEQNFNLNVYVKKCISDSQKSSEFNFEVKRYSLAITDKYEKYFVTLDPQEDFSQQSINSNVNIYLTTWYIFKQICLNAKENNIPIFIIEKHEKYIDFVFKTTDLGNEMLVVIPKYLHGKFGYVINYHFKKTGSIEATREIQKLSLSLDSSGKPNRNFYSDKYNKIMTSITTTIFNSLIKSFNILREENIINMLHLNSDRLEMKIFMFKDNNINISQFKGIDIFGPFKPYPDNPILCFVYREVDKDLSYKLYYALQGKTYSTFSGMEKMFAFKMNKENVIGISVNDYNETEIIKSRVQERSAIK